MELEKIEPMYTSLKETRSLLGVCGTTFYNLRKKKDFPKAVNFGGRCFRWNKEEVLNWAKEQRVGGEQCEEQ